MPIKKLHQAIKKITAIAAGKQAMPMIAIQNPMPKSYLISVCKAMGGIALLCLGLMAPAHAFQPPIGTVQISSQTLPVQSGNFNVQGGTATVNLAVPYISGIQCLHTNTAGEIVGTGADCGASVVPGNGAVIVNVASQYASTYYPVAGSSNTLSGLSPGTAGQILSTQGGAGPPQWVNGGVTAGLNLNGGGTTGTPTLNLSPGSTMYWNAPSTSTFYDRYGAVISTLTVQGAETHGGAEIHNGGESHFGGASFFGGVTFSDGFNSDLDSVVLSTLTVSTMVITNLPSGQCVQTANGGRLSTTGSACGSGASGSFQGLNSSGNPLLASSATLLAGTNVTLTQSGSTITINSSGGSSTLISSGIAFGSASNTVTQDTNSFTFNDITKVLTVVGTSSSSIVQTSTYNVVSLTYGTGPLIYVQKDNLQVGAIQPTNLPTNGNNGNVLIGNRAGGSEYTTPVDSVYLGNFAGNTSTGATDGVLIGEEAGSFANGGTFNTYMGYQAGEKLQCSGGCTMIGAQAGFNSGGSVNNDTLDTCVGSQSCGGLTGGQPGNTALGYQAMGGFFATGGYDVSIGYQAGLVMQGNNSLSLGHNSNLTNVNAGVDGVTAIGNQTEATQTGGIAIGDGAQSFSDRGIATGAQALVAVNAAGSMAFGYGTTVNGANSVGFGNKATIGSPLVVTTTNTFVIGQVGTNEAMNVVASSMTISSITVSSFLTVAGQNVCQANGTNCPASGGGSFSLNASGNVPITSTATLLAGTNVTLTQSGSTITINSSGGGTPSGPNYGVQVDSNGALGASGNFTSDGTSVTIQVPLAVTGTANIKDSLTVQNNLIFGPGFGSNTGALDFWTNSGTFYERLFMTNSNLNSGPNQQRYKTGWNFMDASGNVLSYFNKTTGLWVINSTGTLELYDGPVNHFVAIQSSTTNANSHTMVLPPSFATSTNSFVNVGTINGSVEQLQYFDLYDSSPNWTGQANFTSLSPSTFTALAVTTSLTVAGIAATDNTPLVSISSNNATVLIQINNNGHFVSSGTTPSAPTSCGSSPSMDASVSTDDIGLINVGSGVVTSCTLNFASPKVNAPLCTCDADSAVVCYVSSRSTTAVIFSLAATVGSGHITYHCFGGKG